MQSRSASATRYGPSVASVAARPRQHRAKPCGPRTPIASVPRRSRKPASKDIVTKHNIANSKIYSAPKFITTYDEDQE